MPRFHSNKPALIFLYYSPLTLGRPRLFTVCTIEHRYEMPLYVQVRAISAGAFVVHERLKRRYHERSNPCGNSTKAIAIGPVSAQSHSRSYRVRKYHASM